MNKHLQPLNFFSCTAQDRHYPAALGQCHPPVRMLVGIGSQGRLTRLDQRPGLAIIGSRQATAQGIADAERFAKAVGAAGLTVVSGLAQGIDAAAHRGAMNTAGGTVAVLGHGRATVYPSHHQMLAQEIVMADGALVTEYADDMPALPHHFPQRNRIIAALSRAVLIIEAAPKSGSLITARQALDLGRDVYVVPGSIHQTQSIGSNSLIRQGAQPVQSPEELLEDLGVLRPSTRKAGERSASPEQEKSPASLGLAIDDPRAQLVFSVLSFHPTDVAWLTQRLALSPGEVYAGLLLLELGGRVKRGADGRWLKYKS